MSSITLIIPMYNSLSIQRTLLSVIEQTVPFKEVIIVDDGSTNECVGIAREFSEKYKYIHYVYQQNKGVSAARNHGIAKSKNEYICFLDSDDILVPSMHEVLVRNILETNSLYELYHFNFFQVYANGSIQTNRYFLDKEKNYIGSVFLEQQVRQFSYESKHMVWSYCYNKKFLIDNNLKFSLDLTVFEDIYFLHKLLMLNPSVHVISEELLYYCHDSNSATNISRQKMNEQLGKLYGKMISKNMKKWQLKYLYLLAVKIMKYKEFQEFMRTKRKNSGLFFLYHKINIFNNRLINKIKKEL